MSASTIQLVALVPLLLVRALAAAIEAVLAAGAGPRRTRFPSGDLLAGAACAIAPVASGAAVGVVAAIVWRAPGRAMIPVVLAVVVPVALVLFDLVPRGLAADAPSGLRRRLEPFLLPATLALSPLLVLERLLRGRGAGLPVVMLRRLGTWLAARPGRGPLDVSEAGLVARISRFTAKTAHDVMVPDVDVCAVPDTATIRAVVALVQERGFSRVPVFHERMFNISGIVSSLDLLGVVDLERPVTAVMREPLFVPESKPIPELLETLKAEGRNLAVVVDEYGGTVGLVSVEDVVEEIVGQIEDEYDAPREYYRRVAPDAFLVSARAPVTEVNERFGWNLPQGEYETLGGLVLERLGRVPKPGDSVQAGRVRIEVTRASARAVQELRVQEREQ